jgi:hypothetical protein
MSVTSFKDLPLADRQRKWDADAAERRVRKWSGAEEKPNARYGQAFVWYDKDKKENFSSYKLPIADVIDGKLMAVPRAVFAAAAVVDGARGGVDIPEQDIPRVKSHLAKYYKKMGEEPPWKKRSSSPKSRKRAA